MLKYEQNVKKWNTSYNYSEISTVLWIGQVYYRFKITSYPTVSLYDVRRFWKNYLRTFLYENAQWHNADNAPIMLQYMPTLWSEIAYM